jgi:cytochrome c5
MRHTGWLLSGVVAAAVLTIVASGADAQQPKDGKDGEQILSASCDSSCHDSRPIHMSAKDEAGWKETIDRMLAQGATLSDEDRRLLIPYLVRTHGPIPDGPGKDILLDVCTMCHDLTRIKRVRHTEEEWDEILVTMLNEGAPLSDNDFPVVLSYLTRSFGVE